MSLIESTMSSIFTDFPSVASFLGELDAKNAKSIIVANSSESAFSKNDMIWTEFSAAVEEYAEMSKALSSASAASSAASTLEAEAELAAAVEKRDSISSELRVVKAELASVMDKMVFRQSKIDEMKQKVVNREGTLKEHRDALTSYCENCKSLLGLDFVPTDRDSTILQMTAIDSERKDKTFECELSTNSNASEGEKQFTVIRCDPPLPPEEQKRLEDILNERKDLSGFVVALRRQFLEIAKRRF